MLQQLREAIHGLYCGIESIQRPADAWLQSFRAAAGSWRVCVQLLDAPHLQEHECYFAANNIKAACQKHQDVLEPATLRELLPKLALHMQACLHRQQWPCAVQLAAAAASVAGAAQLQGLLELLLQQLLHCVGVSEDGVAMAAVDFWQDSYLATLQALPQDQQSVLLAQQQAVLEALTAALVRRTQLSAAAAAAATADARDLPEEMRMVRRELASALRDIGSLLGPSAMLSFITQLTASHYQHMCSTHAAANPRCSSLASPGCFTESGLGLQGIAAGLAAGADVYGTTGGPRWGPAGAAAAAAAAASHGAAAGADAHAQALRMTQPAGIACASGCVAGDWLPLESGLYAANVVLGKQRGEAAAQQVQQLVQYAAAAVSHPGGSLKLAGTALTLLGGLAAWLAEHPQSLPLVLPAVIAALQSPDEKLSRNAATCAQRLASCDGLAAQLAHGQPQFVGQLLREYQRRGGLATRADAAQGDDKPTEELLLLCLCSLAVAHTSSSSDMDSILLQLFEGWLAAAVLQLAPESAPWQRQRHGAKVTFVAELTDAACLSDTTRFKRILKNFCGGKKKGGGGGRHL
ncbi:hypothetical protein OEZ86_004758 [Tetradesmus obliquus]|nr:hypothetical protein OEZ86_004758 [Tetradesmus obliquus]